MSTNPLVDTITPRPQPLPALTRCEQAVQAGRLRLSELDEASLVGTALSKWLSPADGRHEEAEAASPLLETLPLNTEQREAVRRALANPLTVVTGPPGTGKWVYEVRDDLQHVMARIERWHAQGSA